MADKVEFELVSPSKLVVSKPVEMVVVPGGDGDLGVLPGHAPMIATVRPGTIAIFEGGQVVERIFVAGGFVEITPDRVAVLAEVAEPVTGIDRAACEQALKDAKDDLGMARGEAEKARAEEAFAVAEARLSAVASPVYA